MRSTRGRIEFRSVSLRDCVATAYRIKDYQVSAPAWLGEQEWEILAKMPDGAPASQMPEMLQTLLAARFRLQVHREKKEQPGFALVVATGGPKLKKSDEAAAVPAGISGRGRMGIRMSTGPAGARIIALRASMAALASTIANLMGKPVADETQLTGTYDFELEFAPEDIAGFHPSTMPAPEASAPAAEAPSEPRPSIFASVQKLGLKLESRKVLVDFIVVDHAEKTPTEN